MEDNKIIELYFARNEDAISETSYKYGRYCHTIAVNILASEEDSQECINDTYMSAWQSIPPARPVSLRAFLAKITRNIALNLLEKKNAQKRGGGELTVILSELSECRGSLDSFTDEFALSQIINRFLGTISVESRKFFVSRYFYSRSIQEIARMYNVGENKVTVSLLRTREKLRTALTKEGINI